jgi:cell division protease FtsH
VSKRRRAIAWVLVGAVVLFVAFQMLDRGTERSRLTLDQFQSQLDDGGVRQATLLDRDHVIEGTLRSGTEFEVHYPAGYTARITQQVVDAGVPRFDVDSQEESAWVGILFNLLPFVLVIGVIFLVLHQTQGGGGKMMVRQGARQGRGEGPADHRVRRRGRARRGGRGAPGDQGVPRVPVEVP